MGADGDQDGRSAESLKSLRRKEKNLVVKFGYTVKGVIAYGFGLSERDLKLLKARKPIVIDLEEIGGHGEALIFYGKTEQIIERDIVEFFGPGKRVFIS